MILPCYDGVQMKAAWETSAPFMHDPPSNEYADERLEFLFVEYLAGWTLVSRVVLRFLLVVAWACSWQKAIRYP